MPFGLHAVYSYKLFAFFDLKALIGLAITALLLLSAFLGKKEHRFFSFSIFWFFLSLLPASNIYPVNRSYMAERWLYFPSIGIFFILGGAFSFLYGIKKARLIAVSSFLALFIFYSFLTIEQNKYWRDPVTFYERTLEYNPESAVIYNELALEYEKAGRIEEAAAAYKKAIALWPQAEGLYLNLANLYRNAGRDEEAKEAYKKWEEMTKKSDD
ncbi:MAG: tetratricopeptide repeat protein, partial [Candidatus Omnitrophica bacterium]|nr:tetratricopeptide repeat protein [Candidatus Omnitrophota bacterium]